METAGLWYGFRMYEISRECKLRALPHRTTPYPKHFCPHSQDNYQNSSTAGLYCSSLNTTWAERRPFFFLVFRVTVVRVKNGNIDLLS